MIGSKNAVSAKSRSPPTLNVSVSTVSRIVNYKRDLSMRRAMILHTEYGIPFDVMYPSQLSEGEGVFVR